MPTYKSESFSWVSGGKKVLPLDFLDRLGPRNGRLVIERIDLQCALNITTVATNTIVGADMAGFARRVRIYDTIGNRVYLTGAKLRVMAHAEQLAAVAPDPTTHGASATQTDTYDHVISFAQDSARRRWDFAMPVDDLKSGGFEIEMPASTDVLQTGSGATINSGTYTVYFHCREEWDVEFKLRDQREEVATTTNTAYYAPIGNRLLRALYLYKEAQGGGSSVTGLGDVTIEPYRLTNIPRDILKRDFLARGLVREAQDPFFNDKAAALIYPRMDAKFVDYSLIPGQLFIRVPNSTVVTPDMVIHAIAPKDERMMREAALENGVDGRGLKVKTHAKSAGDPATWKKLAPYVNMKVDRPGR